MSSAIDATKPTAVNAFTADVRAQLAIAKAELSSGTTIEVVRGGRSIKRVVESASDWAPELNTILAGGGNCTIIFPDNAVYDFLSKIQFDVPNVTLRLGNNVQLRKRFASTNAQLNALLHVRSYGFSIKGEDKTSVLVGTADYATFGNLSDPVGIDVPVGSITGSLPGAGATVTGGTSGVTAKFYKHSVTLGKMWLYSQSGNFNASEALTWSGGSTATAGATSVHVNDSSVEPLWFGGLSFAESERGIRINKDVISSNMNDFMADGVAFTGWCSSALFLNIGTYDNCVAHNGVIKNCLFEKSHHLVLLAASPTYNAPGILAKSWELRKNIFRDSWNPMASPTDWSPAERALSSSFGGNYLTLQYEGMHNCLIEANRFEGKRCGRMALETSINQVDINQAGIQMENLVVKDNFIGDSRYRTISITATGMRILNNWIEDFSDYMEFGGYHLVFQNNYCKGTGIFATVAGGTQPFLLNWYQGYWSVNNNIFHNVRMDCPVLQFAHGVDLSITDNVIKYDQDWIGSESSTAPVIPVQMYYCLRSHMKRIRIIYKNSPTLSAQQFNFHHNINCELEDLSIYLTPDVRRANTLPLESAPSIPFQIGERVVGGISGATGYIHHYRNLGAPTFQFIIARQTGTFVANETLIGSIAGVGQSKVSGFNNDALGGVYAYLSANAYCKFRNFVVHADAQIRPLFPPIWDFCGVLTKLAVRTYVSSTTSWTSTDIFSRGVTNAPPSPGAGTNGVFYLVGVNPTGLWAGHPWELASTADTGTSWTFTIPKGICVAANSIAQPNYGWLQIALNTPPNSGAALNNLWYWIGASPTGAWAGHANDYAKTTNLGASWAFTSIIPSYPTTLANDSTSVGAYGLPHPWGANDEASDPAPTNGDIWLEMGGASLYNVYEDIDLRASQGMQRGGYTSQFIYRTYATPTNGIAIGDAWDRCGDVPVLSGGGGSTPMLDISVGFKTNVPLRVPYVTPLVLDLHASAHQIIPLLGDITMNAPIRRWRGRISKFEFVQDASGTRAITWNAVFKATGAAGSPTANQRRLYQFYDDGTNLVQVADTGWYS